VEGGRHQWAHTHRSPEEEGIPLRRLAPNLLILADADLVPALLPDEAEALTRNRGLVFLPGVVLTYDPGTPLRSSDLVTVTRRPSAGWGPLPDHSPPAPLHEVDREGLPEVVQAMLQQAGEGIATESPASGSWWSGAMGLVSGALGAVGLSSLGRMLDTRKQTEALERLLKQFKDGDTDEALRRALPLGGDEGRGGAWTEDAHLPSHDFGVGGWWGGGSRRAAYWYTDGDMQRRLREAYLKAAEEAHRRGDFRRAAFIHGKLLGDWHEAARLLGRAGLHDEAAEIYLHRIGDRRQAAHSYEAAGRAERALALYREMGMHVEAGDLLRKLGDDDGAVGEYRIAAERLANANRYLEAANLFFRADMPGTAEEYLQRGWQARPGADCVPCGKRLAELRADGTAPEKLLALVDEAGETFRQHRLDHPAADFYQRVIQLTERPGLTAIRADVRDRALLTLAHLLRRERYRGGSARELVPALLGHSATWPASLVADAEAAVGLPLATRAKEVHRDRFRLHEGLVTAVTSDHLNGTQFVAFSDGMIKAYSPESGLVRQVQMGGQRATVALAAESHLGTLFALRQRPDGLYELVRIVVGVQSLAAMSPVVLVEGEVGLIGALGVNGRAMVGVRAGASGSGSWSICLHHGQWGETPLPLPDDTWEAILLRPPGQRETQVACFTVDEVCLLYLTARHQMVQMPRPWPVLRCNMLDHPRLAWMYDGKGHLQVAGIRDPDRVMVGTIPLDGAGEARLHTLPLMRPALAVCWHYPGELAVAHESGITWAKASRTGCKATGTTPAHFGGVVAAGSSPLTREVWVVFEDGELDRLPWPG
jgi:tetratricopeptide (TPR) repeat protein